MISTQETDGGRWWMATTDTHRCAVYYHRRKHSHVVEFDRRHSFDPVVYHHVAGMAEGRALAEKLLANPD